MGDIRTLRTFGKLLVGLGALSALMAIWRIIGLAPLFVAHDWADTRNPIECLAFGPCSYFAPEVYTLLFASFSVLVGLTLTRAKAGPTLQLRRSGALGATLLVPAIALHIFTILPVEGAAWLRTMSFGWSAYSWWPPPEFGLINNLRISAGLDFYWPLAEVENLLGSPALWIYLPFLICLWLAAGRDNQFVSAICKWLLLVLAALLAFGTAAVILDHVDQLQFEYPTDGTVVDFRYYPQFHWYPSTFCLLLLFLAGADLLTQRGARRKDQASPD